MSQRIFKICFSIAVAIAILTAVLFMSVFFELTASDMRERLKNEAAEISSGIDAMGDEYLRNIEFAERITLIDAEGKVIFDSVGNAHRMDNHAEREEVREALETGEGESDRYSDTLSTQTVYYAVRMEDGRILRISDARKSVFGIFGTAIYPTAIIIVLAGACSALFASRLAKNVVRPINEIDLSSPGEVYPEIEPLTERIRRQNDKISGQLRELSKMHDELAAITDNMSEGMILLDAKGKVLSVNASASRLFGVQESDVLGHGVLAVSRSFSLMEAAESAAQGKTAEHSVEIEGRTYSIMSNPVFADGEAAGAVLFILDVTEKRASEQLRREFSANVSHELKTPLTSISGYAEIIRDGIARPEDIRDFSGRIYNEATRLLSMIQDVIRISRLDESASCTETEMEEIDLKEVCMSVQRLLEDAAEQANVTVRCVGAPVRVHGVRELIYEIVHNLAENAVKYNVPGGSVTISTYLADNGHAALCVSDTGIGISAEDKEKIFERFYRVDKSRSKQTGGTGLGLSIVKHAAAFHGADVKLESEIGKGTKVTVIF